MVALETRGRRSGRARLVPLVVAQVGTERYLVSMLCENADWVRNVRASAGAAVLRHRTTETVRLEDVPVSFPIVLIGVRALFEENFLRRQLSGYEEYTHRTRFRLVPYVW